MGRHETFGNAALIACELLAFDAAGSADDDRSATIEEAASLDFTAFTLDMPARDPIAWIEAFTDHAISMHIADRTLRLSKDELVAFIKEKGLGDADVPAAMYRGLSSAQETFEGWGKLLSLALTRYTVAASSAVLEPGDAKPSPQGRQAEPVQPSPVFVSIADGARAAAADALSDARVSADLRAAVEAHRDATLAMLLCADESNEATDPLCAAVEASGESLRAVPARSIADLRCKLALLLPEILPDVNGETPTAFLRAPNRTV